MRQLIACFKLILFGLTLTSYFIAAGVVTLIIKDSFSRRKMLTRLIARYARFTCSFMGLHVYPLGTMVQTDSALIVGNHLSYLDIIAHASLRSSCFVTSVEIRDTPILGEICKMAACVFVERRNRDNLSKEISEVSESLKNGINVTIFPEATSTNGDEVLRFKRPLFQAAIDANTPIIPVTINYEKIDGKIIDLNNRDDVCWYGDMDFFPHLWRVLNLKRVDINIIFHDVISPNSNSSDLAEQSHQVVSSSYDNFEQREIKSLKEEGVFA